MIKAKHLSVLSYSNGFRLWHARSTDLIRWQDIKFEDECSKVLRTGDVVFLTSMAPKTYMFSVCVIDDGTTREITINRLAI